MGWYNKDFRNAYLMFGIMAAMFIYMGVSLLIVGNKVGNNRSCIVTCDVDLQSDKKISKKTDRAE
jgi:hypothetical protein